MSFGFLEDLILRILEHQSYPKPHLPHFRLVCPDVHTVQQNLSLCGTQQPVQVLNQRGLAGAGMSDNPHKGACFNFQIYMIYCRFFKRCPNAIAIGQSFCLYRCHLHTSFHAMFCKIASTPASSLII